MLVLIRNRPSKQQEVEEEGNVTLFIWSLIHTFRRSRSPRRGSRSPSPKRDGSPKKKSRSRSKSPGKGTSILIVVFNSIKGSPSKKRSLSPRPASPSDKKQKTED